MRLVLAALFLAIVIAGSLITRTKWAAPEKSISEIVGFLTPEQSNLVYLLYGVAILALPLVILVSLIATRQWKLLGAYAAAGLIAVVALSISAATAYPRQDMRDVIEHRELSVNPQPRLVAPIGSVSGPHR